MQVEIGLFRFFPFVPIFVAVFILAVSLALLVFGVRGMRRSREGTIRAIGVAAVIGGVLMFLSLFAAFAQDAPPVASFFILALVGTVVWMAALADCAMKESDQGNNKIAWVIIIVFTHALGGALYLLVRRPQRVAELGR